MVLRSAAWEKIDKKSDGLVDIYIRKDKVRKGIVRYYVFEPYGRQKRRNLVAKESQFPVSPSYTGSREGYFWPDG